jgi:hypothetical protein
VIAGDSTWIWGLVGIKLELEEAGVRRCGRRQRFSLEQKRQIVEATLVGSSRFVTTSSRQAMNGAVVGVARILWIMLGQSLI